MRNKLILLLRLLVAGILMQTLFFKFTGAKESVYIFSKLGVEPWGRWLSGIAELIASVLILIPQTQILGALLAAGVMFGALLSHVFILGLIVADDGGLLFSLACTVLISALLVLVIQRRLAFEMAMKIQRLLPKKL